MHLLTRLWTARPKSAYRYKASAKGLARPRGSTERGHPDTKLPRRQAGPDSVFSGQVERTGLEPVAYCLQSNRATNCANAPSASYGRRLARSSHTGGGATAVGG